MSVMCSSAIRNNEVVRETQSIGRDFNRSLDQQQLMSVWC